MSKRALAQGLAAVVVGASGAGVAATATAATSCSYYVSPSGSDTAAGTLAAPWKTPEGARDRIRTAGLNDNLSADLTVCLRGGRYTLSNAWDLSDQDSGSNGHQVIYTDYNGETPIIDGGRAVTGWSQVSGKSYWSANVPTSSGFASYFRQLYVNGVRAQLATSKPISGSAWFDAAATTQTIDGIVFPTSSLKSYTNPTDVRLFHVGAGFKADYFPVVALTPDGTNTKVQLQQPYTQARYDRGTSTFNYNHTFYVQNALEELDSAGEWYLDQVAHKVYYQPKAGESMTSASVFAPVVETLLSVNGASGTQKAHDITFDGLVFEHGNWALPKTTFIGGSQAEALYIAGPGQPVGSYNDEVPGTLWLTNTEDVRFVNNVVRYSGNGGLHLRTGAESTTVTGNQFYNLTAAGIIVGRWKDHTVTADARTRNTVINNNVVHDTGDDFMQGTGISLINSYNSSVTHNLVFGTAYSGIHQRKSDELLVEEGVDGIGNTTISYNKVINGGDKKMWGMYDNGAFYSFGAIPGTNIHHNLAQKVTTNRAFMSDNQSYQTRWDDNVADGGPFSAYMPGRSPQSVYAGRNYTTTSSGTSYAYFTFDIDGPPHVVTGGAWPAEAQAIMAGAGLEPAYASLETSVPSQNLADYATIAATGGGIPATPAKLWDGVSETGEVTATASEGWVQYDFAHDYEGLTFRLQNDNGGTYMTTSWKVQRWSTSQAAWVDIMPYQTVSTANQVQYTPRADLATTKIRLYVKNDNAGGIAGLQEFSVTGTVK